MANNKNYTVERATLSTEQIIGFEKGRDINKKLRATQDAVMRRRLAAQNSAVAETGLNLTKTNTAPHTKLEGAIQNMDTKSLENNPTERRKLTKLDLSLEIKEIENKISHLLIEKRKLQQQFDQFDNSVEDSIQVYNSSQDTSSINKDRTVTIEVPYSYMQHLDHIPVEVFAWNVKDLQKIPYDLRYFSCMIKNADIRISTDLWGNECSECGEPNPILTDNVTINLLGSREGTQQRIYKYRCLSKKASFFRTTPMRKTNWFQDVPLKVVRRIPPDKLFLNMLKRKGYLTACSLLKIH